MDTFTLQGSIAALVTPFNSDGSIDYASYDALLDFHLENGTSGVVVCGTTGETPTLSEKEDAQMFEHTMKRIGGKMTVIAGTGSNSTASCISYTKNAASSGVDAVLVVGPYYNKPTAEGMYLHFAELANNVNLPIILYNVPGRTGSAIKPTTVFRLANDFENIVGIKEASGNIGVIETLVEGRKKGFKIYSGDDGTSMISNLLGADGCISVACNIIPKEFAKMMELSLAGKAAEAREIHYKYRHLMDLLFVESNPIPVKAALAAMGMMKEEYRLPLCKMANENKALLLAEMKKLGLIK